MASVGFDSSDRDDHMTRMTGTACDVDITSWKPASSVEVMSGMCRPSPAGAVLSSVAGAEARADRSMAPCESAGVTAASGAPLRGSGVFIEFLSRKHCYPQR